MPTPFAPSWLDELEGSERDEFFYATPDWEDDEEEDEE